ncbi:hypothetical protein ACFVGY_02180 [Streptomyces sp. NPDC127106]|uniref:hypothetical protein n=1 Tax=Streptomyces sp. NPDC127106 TaxID=3345360 RepID=UPI003624E464
MREALRGSGPRRRTVLAATLTALATAAGCSTEEPARPPAQGPEGAADKDALVMVIRHGEKPYAGDTGEDGDGKQSPGFLAGRGRRRAQALPRLFTPTRSALLPRPAAVFAAGGAAAPARCRQTVAPLAAALHTRVRAEFAVGAEAALAGAVLAAPMPVLVCWEHQGVPRLIRSLGAHRVLGVPAVWPDRYDLVWLFTRSRGRWSFRELPQHLLAGDA